MNGYIILIKAATDEQRESYELVPHQHKLDLQSMYDLIGCDLIDVKDTNDWGAVTIGDVLHIPAMTLVFDDEFLLKTDNPQANRLASVLNQYPWLTNQCLCGNVLLCQTTEDGEMMPFDEETAKHIEYVLQKLDDEVIDKLDFKVQ